MTKQQQGRAFPAAGSSRGTDGGAIAARIAVAAIAAAAFGPPAQAGRSNPAGFTQAASSSVDYTATPYAAQADCAALPSLAAEGTTITTAAIPAETGVPAHCRVTGNIPAEIGFEINLPLRWKHTLAFAWAKDDWSHSLTQVYRAGYEDEEPVSVASGSYIPVNWNPDVDSYITYNYSLAWTGMEHARIAFTVRNLLNTDPPFTAHQVDFASGAAWEPRVADPRGRSFNLTVEYTFH